MTDAAAGAASSAVDIVSSLDATCLTHDRAAIRFWRANCFQETNVAEPRQTTWYRWDELAKEKVNDLLSRRLITGDRVMLAHVYLKKGCVVPKHSHENEQFTYILEGALKFF